MKAYDFKVLLEPDETGGYVATCPSLPGCYSQGVRSMGPWTTSAKPSSCAWKTCRPTARSSRILPEPWSEASSLPDASGLPVVSGREVI
jgi:hypothetical protein